jgi:hypothetical protein
MADYKFSNNSTTLGVDNQTSFVPNPTVPIIYRVRGRKWMSFGSDNLFPSYITELYNKSAINRTAINSKVVCTFGEGLKTVVPELEYILSYANDDESFNDVFEKVCLDWQLYGSFALNIIWNATGDRIHSFHHLPFPSIRSGEIDPKTDKVEKYYYSSNWTQWRKWLPLEMQAFDINCAIEHPSQILYYNSYNPSSQYYSLPSWIGGASDITTDIEVSNFHLSNLANGLNPSLFISYVSGTPSIENQKQIYDQLTANFSGTSQTGRFFLSFSDSPDQAPTVTPINSANDQYYLALESRITSRIIAAHSISSPLLLGLYHEGGGGLGSNKDEIMVAYEHFKATVIEPDIKALLKPFDKIVKLMGYDTKLYVEPLKMFPEGKDEVDNSVATAIV